jgi:hypothetical protein
MPRLPSELDERFGSFRHAWEIPGREGYITEEIVGGSKWYVIWLKLDGRWEYLLFGESESENTLWDPIFGDFVGLAGAIGQNGKLNLVIETVTEGMKETWFWIIYWRRRGQVIILSVLQTNRYFAFVV